ncbi:MAG: DUF411 domain-containing protein [Gemmatimonadota bacterium]
MNRKRWMAAIAGLVLVLAGVVAGRLAGGGSLAEVAEASPGEVVVYKSPTCGCCTGWVTHMREAGFEVRAVDTNDLAAAKVELGVDPALQSCHTAVVDGYFVEGHVPAEQVRRLLEEQPDVAGLAVPGMPVGSPGMEGPDARPYDVLAVSEEGEASVFARVDPRG